MPSCDRSVASMSRVLPLSLHTSQDLPPSLDDFLLPLTHEAVADICVVGTQECGCDVREWEVLLQQTLGPSHVLVHSRQMGALHMVAFIRRDLLWHCSGGWGSELVGGALNRWVGL